MRTLSILRLLAPGLALLLAGCGQSNPEATPPKTNPNETKGPPPAPNLPVTFKPRTGRAISPDEVPLLELINRENTKVLSVAFPTIVRVTAKRQADPKVATTSRDMLPFHFGPGGNRIMPPNDPAYGSGVIISRDGYIVTNNHVLENAVEILVQFQDKKTLTARLVASDAPMDVAVLKVEAKGLPALSWGNSDEIQVGEQVFAIGNPFNLEAGASVSRGIVSATSRILPESPAEPPHYETFIQTDAAINPGNSGGALINIHGELIGINTAIASMSGGNEGVGFAIPSNFVRYAVEELLKHGRVIRGYLGVTWPQTVDEGEIDSLHLDPDRGVLLSGVQPNSPAADAGLHAGDFITGVDGHKIHGLPNLQILVSQLPVGKDVVINYIRSGTAQTVKVKVAELPTSTPPVDAAPALGKTGDSTPADDDNSVPVATRNVLSGLQVNELNDKNRKKFAIGAAVETGVIVNKIDAGSLAETKGVQKGDVIESASLNHEAAVPLAKVKDFTDLSQKMTSDQSVVLLIRRGKGSSFVYLAPSR